MRPAERFPWGKIIEEYEVGPYHIARYRPFVPLTSSTVKPRIVDEAAAPRYHAWVDGKDTSLGALTLEGALIYAIAHKMLGSHPPGTDMICRALKVECE